MAAATSTPRRRISGALSASAAARISSSPAPPRPITASADRISRRAGGSLNACFSATTPSGSPSNALAMPRGTGRRPFSTSRSQPGTAAGRPPRRGSARRRRSRSCPRRARRRCVATVSRPRPAAARSRCRPSPSRAAGWLGRKLSMENRRRPSRTTTRAAPPASGGSSPSVYERRESAKRAATSITTRATAIPNRIPAAPHDARRTAGRSSGERPPRGDGRRRTSSGTRRRSPGRASDGAALRRATDRAGPLGHRRTRRTTSRSAGCASVKTSVRPRASARQQPLRSQRRQRLRAAIATCRVAARPGRRQRPRRASRAATSARRATAPPDFAAHFRQPDGRQHRRAAAATVTTERRQPQIDDGPRRQLQIERPARPRPTEIGSDRGGQAALERGPRLDRALLEDVGDVRFREARARSSTRASAFPAAAVHRLQPRERRLVDAQHETQPRPPSSRTRSPYDQPRSAGSRVGQRLLEVIEDRAPARPSPRAPRRPR